MIPIVFAVTIALAIVTTVSLAMKVHRTRIVKNAALSISAATLMVLGLTNIASASLAPRTISIDSNVATSGTAGTPITLTATASAGTGTITFSATGSGCVVTQAVGSTPASVNASVPTTCAVRATIAADSTHASAISLAKSITFAAASQAGLYVNNQGTDANIRSDVTLLSTGGSGTGAVTYTVTGSNCVVTGTKLTVDTSTGHDSSFTPQVCAVTAHKAARGIYASTSSPALNITFQNIAYAAHLVSVTGLVAGTHTLNYDGNYQGGGYTWFLNQYYSSLGNWDLNYVPAGATVTETWKVVTGAGEPAKDLAVTFEGAVAQGNGGGSWDGFGISKDPAPGVDVTANGFRMTGYTNNTGEVSFTFVNTDTGANVASGINPADESTPAGANGNLATYPYSRGALIVGRPSTTAGSNGAFTSNEWPSGTSLTWDAGGNGPSATTQVTDLVDLIVVPGAGFLTAQSPLSISNTVTSVANGALVTLTTQGGSGTGSVSYHVTGTGCSVTSNILRNSGTNSACTVTATKAADGTYAAITSAAVVFGFGSVDNPTNGSPDTATIQSVTGGTGTLLDDSAAGRNDFTTQYFNAADTWGQYYVPAGSSITETWKVLGSNGLPLADQQVTLTDNQAYSGSTGTTWSNAALNANPGGQVTGTTNGSGIVTFTLVNTNANANVGSAPTNAELTTTGENSGVAYGAEGYEQTSGTAWTRTFLTVGSDNIGSGGNQITGFVDLLVIPTS